MAAVPGPRKLIFIDSGVYPYAEIELDESVHLAGPNNAGKTSLLNALQFLYIDDIKIMHFPNTNFRGKTQPFYFKQHGRSTILIEADTRWGIRTVGFHGLGAVAGCDWQRFGFDGPYVKDDFIDPETRQPRDWPLVEAILAQKDYVKLTQAQLRGALRGAGGERNGFRLDLVPGGGRYDTFIEVFRQLLTLKKSRPDDLKTLLLSVIEEDMVSGEEGCRGVVSLSSVVGDSYTRALAAQKRLERIQAVQARTQTMLAKVGLLEANQAVLPGMVKWCYQEAMARYRDRTRRAIETRENAEEAKELAETKKAQRLSLETELGKTNRRIGALENQVESLRDIQDRLASEPKGLLEAKLSSLREDESQLRVDLSAFQGSMDGSHELRVRAQRQRQNAKSGQDAADRLMAIEEDGVRQSWLDLLADYPDEERDPLLRMLNPAILSLPEGDQGMTVLNAEGIDRLLLGVARASQGGFFLGNGVKVNLSALPTPPLDLDDPVVRAQQIEKYLAQAAQANQEARRLEELAEASRGREGIRAQLDKVEAEVAALVKKTVDLANWEEEVKKLPGLEAELAAGEQEATRTKGAIETAAEEWDKAQTLSRTMSGRATSLENEARALMDAPNGPIHRMEQMAFVLPEMDLDDGMPEAPSMDDAAFQDLVKKTDEKWRETTEIDKDISDRLGDIEQDLDGMIAGDREQQIAALKDLIDGLEPQREQVNDAWQSIAVTAKTAFSNLLRDYETLETRVRRLNRAMGKFTVSNLSDIQLLLVPTPKMDILKNFTQEESLFIDVGLAERARNQIGEWLAQSQPFRLFDLFQVSLEVQKGKRKEIYSTLEAESTGTAMTLKVIFLAHLLRDLYHSRADVRLLIFVDEVDTLDDVNQETIRECARELGFIMIMASPNPANAKRLYFLRPEIEGEVTYIYPEETLEIVFKDEPEIEIPTENESDAAETETLP